MARKATKGAGKSRAKDEKKPRSSGTAVVRRSSASGSDGSSRSQPEMGEAFIKLLQSPFVAELVAVAATAALAALAEHGFTSSGGEGSRSKRARKAVKQAGKAAAAAVGRRLTNELDEIRKAAKDAAKA